jgi:hypothetical protein
MEKVYTIRDSDNYLVLNEYNNTNYGVSASLKDGCYFYSDKRYTAAEKIFIEGYRLVSFEYFKKHVIDKEPIFNDFLIFN